MSYREIAAEQIKADEGVVPHAYQDTEGFWTIGCGRLIDQRRGGKLRADEIDLMLENDIRAAEYDAKALFECFDRLSDTRKAVLLNMAFNLGRNRLAGFVNFRAAVEIGDFTAAADHMLSSKWAAQVKGRAVRLAKMIRGD